MGIAEHFMIQRTGKAIQTVSPTMFGSSLTLKAARVVLTAAIGCGATTPAGECNRETRHDHENSQGRPERDQVHVGPFMADPRDCFPEMYTRQHRYLLRKTAQHYNAAVVFRHRMGRMKNVPGIEG